MRKLEPTGRFKRDYKLLQKQQIFDREAFDYVINQLANDIPLEEKYRDHELRGNFEGARECHIKPDWLLIYAKDKEKLRLILMRTGSHSNLFGM